jgi:hyperosmotically inducible periplasmic protein
MARAVAALLVLFVLSGCSLAGRTVGSFVDDKTLTAKVKMNLVKLHPSALKRVNVDVYENTVYLSGFVEHPIEKSDAEIAARRTEGVKQVVNDLVVRGDENSTAAASRTPVAASPPTASSLTPSTTRPAAAAPSPGPPRGSVRRTIPGVVRLAPAWPGGPDHAFDKDGKVVATIYTVSAQDLAESDIRNLPTDGRLIDHVSMYALIDRGVVPGPRYALVLWHVNEAAANALLR